MSDKKFTVVYIKKERQKTPSSKKYKIYKIGKSTQKYHRQTDEDLGEARTHYFYPFEKVNSLLKFT